MADSSARADSSDCSAVATEPISMKAWMGTLGGSAARALRIAPSTSATGFEVATNTMAMARMRASVRAL